MPTALTPTWADYNARMDAPEFPSHLTPLERAVLTRLVASVADQAAARSLVLFGSRSRGHSHTESDLDIAVRFVGSRDRALERWLSELEAEAGQSLPSGMQAVPLFEADPPSRLQRTLDEEGVTLWTKD